MRQNLTKKEIINSIYMQLGYSKKLIENILEDLFDVLLEKLKQKGKVKISNFGTFTLRHKNLELVEILKKKRSNYFEKKCNLFLSHQNF